MKRQPKLGETSGDFLLLVKKVNGGFLIDDEKRLRGIICFFEFILSKSVPQELLDENETEKRFKSFSTNCYLGPDFKDLKMVIKEGDKELFVLEKTEDILKIIKRHELEIDLSILERTVCTVREYLNRDCLVDPKEGAMMVLDEIYSVHSMSIEIINNKTSLFHISF